MVNVLNCDLIALMLFTLTQGDSYFPFLPYSCFPITPIFIVENYLSFFAPPDNHIMQRARLIESWTSRQASTGWFVSYKINSALWSLQVHDFRNVPSSSNCT